MLVALADDEGAVLEVISARREDRNAARGLQIRMVVG